MNGETDVAAGAPRGSERDETDAIVIDPAAIDQTAVDELARRIDARLGDLEKVDCADAASRLAPVLTVHPAERPEGEAEPAGARRERLRDATRAVEAALAELDLIERVHDRLTEVQVLALTLGRAMGEADEPPPRSDGADRPLADEVLELGTTLTEVLRVPHGAFVETGLARYAAVSSAATRAARALDAEDPDPDERGGAETDELGSRVHELREWLADRPLADLRSAVAVAIQEPPVRKKSARTRRRATGDPAPEALRTRWDRAAAPDRFAGELRRLALVSELLDFRIFLDAFVRSHLLAEPERVSAAAARYLGDAVSALRALHDEAERGFRQGSPLPPSRLLRRGMEALRAAESGLGSTTSTASLADAATEGLSELTARIGRLPESLEISPLPDPDETAGVDDDLRRVEPRGWAEDAFGSLALERLRDAARPYDDALARATALVPGARTVLEYNLGAADELSATEHDDDAARIREELVLGGLDRTADRLQDAVVRLNEVRQAAPLVADALLAEAVSAFNARARAESSLEGRARDVWSSIREGAELAGTWAEREARRLGRAAVSMVASGSTRAVGALHRARAVVGADPVATARVDATVRVIADVEHAADQLPFVYRRLFSYRPLSDPSLLVGREDACAFLDEHLERWQRGLTDALLVSGASGVGLSSLLEVCRERWGDSVEWRTITLTDRVLDESRVARLLADGLELGETPATLADLGARISARPAAARPTVCVVDNFEMLYRRGVLDPGPIDETLRFMATSDASVLWIAPLADSAWQVLQALRPGVASLARVFELSPLDRVGIETAVLSRHQRSGIPVRYETGAALPIGLRRAHARAGSDDDRQALLRTAFFDRLYELSEGYVALAIVYWLRSIRLDEATEVIHISTPDPIDFGAWDDLDAAGAFALKAILEHGSLTLAEYSDVFGASEDEAFSVFERLSNLLIIHPVQSERPAGVQLRIHRIEPRVRYRVRPVLVRPVERLLTARRLLY